MHSNYQGVNSLLKFIATVKVKDEKAVAMLSDMIQDESVPLKVRNRAWYRFAALWREADKRYAIVQKAKATRQKNELEKAAAEAHKKANLAYMRKRYEETIGKNPLVQPDWVNILLSMG